MKIMIMGAGGFIGRSLTRRLLDDGHDVLAVDTDLSAFKPSPNLELMPFDVRSQIGHGGSRCKLIYNLACDASPPKYLQDPLRTLTTCSLGMERALSYAKLFDARVVFTSTSEVYGDPTKHPQHEEYWGHVNPIGERSCYDEGKRFAEALCAAYHRTHFVDVRIARIFNTYGPDLDWKDGRVVSRFVWDAINCNQLPVHGNGLQTRSFCYIDDTVEALVRLGMSDEPDVVANPVNIGNPNEITIMELAERVNALTKNPNGIMRYPKMVDDPTRRCPDIGRAKRLLGWEPTVDLETGLRRVIARYRNAPT